MAWNDPGRNDDPWSRGGGQAPPDLDEAFRKFQARLGRLFGGRGGSSGGKTGFNWRTVGIGLVVLVVAYGVWGVYQLDEQERGVIFRFGKVLPEAKMPGINWRPQLIDELRRVNITRVESHKHQAEMLTKDDNIVFVDLTVQYRRSDPIDYVTKVNDPVASLVDATESALRHAVGGSEMEPVLTEGRVALGQEVEERIQRYLDDYESGIEVVTVNIDDSAPPDPVQAAFDDVQKAKEDRDRAVNDAEAYAASSLYDSASLRVTFAVHLAVAVPTFIAWCGLATLSWRRYSLTLPGSFGRTHRRWGWLVLVGLCLSSATGIALYVMSFGY